MEDQKAMVEVIKVAADEYFNTHNKSAQEQQRKQAGQQRLKDKRVAAPEDDLRKRLF